MPAGFMIGIAREAGALVPLLLPSLPFSRQPALSAANQCALTYQLPTSPHPGHTQVFQYCRDRMDATPFVRLMCVAAFFASLGRLTQWLFLSRGETRRQLRWAAYAQTPGMLAAVLIGTLWGAIGVAAGFTVGTSVLTIPAIVYCLHSSPIRVCDFIAASARPILGAAAAAGALLVAGGALPQSGSALPDMVVRLAVFTAVYAGAWLGLPGGRRAAAEAVATLKELRARPVTGPAGET